MEREILPLFIAQRAHKFDRPHFLPLVRSQLEQLLSLREGWQHGLYVLHELKLDCRLDDSSPSGFKRLCAPFVQLLCSCCGLTTPVATHQHREKPL
jgi:hypothetical protein